MPQAVAPIPAVANEPGHARPPDLLYAVNDRPPALRLALLGIQYAIMSAIYLVLVAIILRHAATSQNASVTAMGIACIGLAIGTALQALPRGPIGSGFLAPPVFSAVYLAPSVLAAEIGGMRLVFGMTLFAGAVEAVLALGLRRLRFVITPVLTGLTVLIVGLQLGVVGIGEVLDVAHEHLPTFPLHLVVTTLTLMVPIALSIWGRGAAKLVATLLGLIAGMIAALLLGLIEPARVVLLEHLPWLAMPAPRLLDFGFDLQVLPAFVAAGIAAGLRATGVVSTCQRINDPAWRSPDNANIRRGVLADGIANVIGGAIGVTGMSIGPSLVGMSAATGATSRAIAFVAALVLVVFGFSPKVAGFFLAVPSEVAGSLLVFTACFMIAGGMQLVLTRPLDTRATYIIGIATLLGLSESVFPGYFQDLPRTMRSISGSPLALSLSAAVILILVFRLGPHQRAETRWAGTESSMAQALNFLRTQGRAWKVPASLLDASITHASDVMAYIMGHDTNVHDATLRVSFNGYEWRVGLSYPGYQITQLPPAARPTMPSPGELDNEEAAAVHGLRDFLASLSIDRKDVTLRHGQVTVRLFYAV